MFYCENCKELHGLPVSVGKREKVLCEYCGEYKWCNNVPSKDLPLKTRATARELAWWVLERWDAQVKHRPDENIYRRILHATWGQIYTKLTGKPIPRPEQQEEEKLVSSSDAAILNLIPAARDFHADHGFYPDAPYGPDKDQAFDDWAADLVSMVLTRTADPKPCDPHEWGIDGAHSNVYCKKCFVSKEAVDSAS